MKALVICAPAGRPFFWGGTRPGSMHDLTQARTAGLVGLLLYAPLGIRVLADAGEAAGTSRDRRQRQLRQRPDRPARGRATEVISATLGREMGMIRVLRP
ncbi:hypothetical protein ACQPYV_12545 [Micromonospora saelicesensis]|uniref:hypothetical protein n=1 Tax=Micromonospora saelicesensis TaxID=285676 RepID=UPI003D92C05D